MAKKWFILEVAPLTVLPFRKAIFSYKYSKTLTPGSVVTVPLSGRTLSGVVLKSVPSKEGEPEGLKSIQAVEERAPLTHEQLVLAQAVSAMTFTPLGKVLKHFVPKKAKVRTAPKEASFIKKHAATKTNLAKIKKVLAELKTADTLFVSLSAHEKSIATLLALLKNLQAKKPGQILFLMPDISTAVRLEKNWAPYCKPGELVSLYHTKTPGQYYRAWQDIQGGVAQIIIATRHGLFAPFQKLHTIIQLDPGDESYKQWDMSPRYHAEHIIPELQRIWNAQFIGVGVVPSLGLLKKKAAWIDQEKYPAAPEWINLKIERFQKNWSVFSLPLQTAMREALSKRQQILLYVHQSGLESFSVCKECRTVFRCPNCQSALKLTLADRYHCKHCNFKSNLFPQCPNCKNIHFKSVGYGTEKVAKEAHKLFPGAEVAIADKKHLSDHKKVSGFLDSALKKAPDMLIATSSFLRFPPLSQLSLVAIIDADILLNLPGFRKDEQFIELIEKAKSLLRPDGRLLVQSFHPESDLFDKITNLEIHSLLGRLLEERAALRYPPEFRSLILTARPKLKNAEALLKKAATELKSLLAKKSAVKKIITVQSSERKEKSRLQKYTLIRYLPPLPPLVENFLAEKADTLLIDHDPLHIT